jgi:hypothetical protein
VEEALVRKGIRCVPVGVAGAALVFGLIAGSAGAAQASSASSVFGPTYKAMLAAKTAQVTLDITGEGGATATGACNFPANYCEYNLLITIPGEGGAASTQAKATEILTGGNLYMKLPTGLGGNATKPWTETSAFGLAGSSSSEDEDPSETLSLLSKYATAVTKIGSATIGGVSTTEYSATVNQAAVKGATAAQKALGPIPLKAWIDSKHRIVQLSESLDSPSTPTPTLAGSPPTTTAPPTSFTIGFSHYGEHVTETVPPADQVTKS